MRHPDSILNDLDALGVSRELVWEIIEDVRDSFILAMQHRNPHETDNDIVITVDNYLGNLWGDD